MATSKVLKPRRGSTTEHATFKGQAFEITFDTDKKTIVAHDGLTMGGFPLAHEAAVAETDEALRALIDQKVSEVEGVSSSELRALESALRGLISNNAQQQVARDADQDNVIAALDSTLRTLIEKEVGEAETSTDSKVSALDSTLRALIANYLPLAGGTMHGALGFALSGEVLATFSSFIQGDSRRIFGLYPQSGAEVHLGSLEEGETLQTVACKRLAGPWARAIGGANEYNPDIVILHGYDEASGAGFIRFSSGLLIQWGKTPTINAAPSIVTVPLHLPYKNGNYYVECNCTYGWSGGDKPTVSVALVGLPQPTFFRINSDIGPVGSFWFTLGVGA